MAAANFQFAVDLERLNELARNGEISAERLADAQAKLRAEHEKNVAALEAMKTPFQRLLDDMRFEQDLLGMTNEQREIAVALRWANVDAASAEGKALADQVGTLHRLREAYAEMAQTQDRIRGEFSDFITGVVSGTEAIADAFKRMVDNINAVILQRIADNWVERLFGSQGSTGDGTAGGNFLGNILGMLFGGGRATGGWIGAGSFAEVNERGIEMATVNGRSYLLADSPVKITPNDQLTGGRAVAVTQHFHQPVLADRRSDSQRAAEAGRRQREALRNA